MFKSSGTQNTHLRHLIKLQKLRRSLHPLCNPRQRRALVKVADVFLQKRAQNAFSDYTMGLRVLLDGGFPPRQAEVIAQMVAGSPEFWKPAPVSKHCSRS